MKEKTIVILCCFLSFTCFRVQSSDLLIDYFLPEVERNGDEKEIEIYREFTFYYVEIKKELEEDDYESAFRLIDKYISMKNEYLKREVTKRERFYITRFIGTSLYIKSLVLFQSDPWEAIELLYCAGALIHQEYQRMGEDIMVTAFMELMVPILRLGTPEQELRRFRQGVLPPSFISYIPEVEKEISAKEATENDQFALIPQVLPVDFDRLMDLLQGFHYFKYLKPLEKTLVITYNPKSQKARNYIKELQKTSGLRIRKKKDYSYDFFQMYARIDLRFAQQIFRKYCEKRS